MAGRVTQEAVEVVVLPTTQSARITQEAVEVVILPTDQRARLTQEAVEVLVLPTSQKARITQFVIEAIIREVWGYGAVTTGATASLTGAMSLAGTGAASTAGDLTISLDDDPFVSLEGTGAVVTGATANLSADFNVFLGGTGEVTAGGTADVSMVAHLQGAGAVSTGGTAALRNPSNVGGAGPVLTGGSLALTRVVSGAALQGPQFVADATARRPGVYTEIAAQTMRADWASDGRVQHIDLLDDEPGWQSLSHLAVCRMGDMRGVMALVSGDPGSDDQVVTVRVQSGVEAWGFPHEAFRFDGLIHDVVLCPIQNPLNTTHALGVFDRWLVLGVWYGGTSESANTSFTLLLSEDRGQTWTEIWDEGAFTYLEAPRMLTHAGSGALYLVFRSNEGGGTRMLRYLRNSTDPLSWPEGFGWDGGPITIDSIDLRLAGGQDAEFDIIHDGRGWALGIVGAASGGVLSRRVGLSESSTPTGFELGTANLASGPDAVDWVRVGRTGRYNEFGQYPGGRLLIVWQVPDEGHASYTVVDPSPNVGDAPQWVYHWDNYPMYKNAGEWQLPNAGWFCQWNAADGVVGKPVSLADKDHWIGRVTPSASVIYGTDTGNFAQYVELDNHGPTPTDHDVGQRFAGFWTRSTERDSVAFPQFDGTRDLQIDFAVWPLHGRYHNIWFAIEDPAHPGTPIFKMDYYVGNDVEGGHPHDTARGCRVTFCKRIWPEDRAIVDPNAGSGRYKHPLRHCFDGFPDRDQNDRKFEFRIIYNHLTDEFELRWRPTPGTGSYVPFIPYSAEGDDREAVDIGPAGTSDVYVPSPTELYWKQPRNGLWPTRFYVGCPETKPAIEEQSTLRVGHLAVTQGGGSADGVFVSGRPSLVPRMGGGLDFCWIDATQPDLFFRESFGYPWQDVLTATRFSSDVASDEGPDQATLVVLDQDNYERNLYGEARARHCFAWARSGTADRVQGLSEWAAWVPLFFGTSDTGESTDTGEGPLLTMRMFSPLRAATRSYRTQTFTSLPPPAQTDENGDPLEPPVKDVKKLRESEVIYMIDFDHPNDDTLPLDSRGRLMKFDDYIARFGWEDILGLPPGKLELDRVGVSPQNFALNGTEGEGNILSDLSELWVELGLTWHYDYGAGGILRVQKRTAIQGVVPEAADYQWRVWTMVSAPFSRDEDDWGRAGNVQTSATNMESQPNSAVARVAPWPDGSDTLEKSLDAFGGRGSQEALGRMYATDQPKAALYKEWEGARAVTVPVQAWPYAVVGMTVWVLVDNILWPEPFRSRANARYADLKRVWLVRRVRTEWSVEGFQQEVTLVDPLPFPTEDT